MQVVYVGLEKAFSFFIFKYNSVEASHVTNVTDVRKTLLVFERELRVEYDDRFQKIKR